MNHPLLDKIVALAHADPDIRAVILEGSFATGSHTDELSDYDIDIYAHSYNKYLEDHKWLSEIGEVMLYQKEQLQYYDAVIPSRLVVFRDRARVDFTFWPLALLSEMVAGKKEYESYRNGYRILVDKDGLAGQLKPPDGTGFRIEPPGRDHFLQTIYDFWFEAYCVARYLARGDLWLSKRIEDSYAKDHLYSMMLWHHQAANGWQPDPRLHLLGKRFETWAPPELVAGVASCFSSYNVDATWRSLFAMVALFNRLARETSERLHMEYPERVERDVLAYLKHMRGGAPGPSL